ncbi:MAG: terminase large subunit [Deltaproteobacteria bacterium]|nr:terminase large subunit [Deltaproteobacteria bacterium]
MNPSEALSGVQRAKAYARDVLSGKITACVKVQKAARRFLRDLEREGRRDCPWKFDEERAERPITFMERYLVPTKGGYDKMLLLPWQCFAICNVYGWVYKSTGLRRFREALIYVGSGNGKSTMVSGLAVYMASKDGEKGASVTLFANSKDQAAIVYDECKREIENCPKLYPKHFRTTNAGIFYDAADASIVAHSNDLNAKDGLNPSCAVFDEIHEFKDFRLLNLIKPKMLKRRQGLTWYLTTAGYVNEGPLDSYYRLFSSALEEGKLDPLVSDQLFSLIYELDEDDRIEDYGCWVKANPSIGYLLNLTDMRAQWEKVKSIPQERANFICKNLNLKVNADEASFVDWSVIRSNDDTVDLDGLEGHVAYAGFDLSTREDFTAAAIECPLPDGRVFVLHHSWVPRKKLETCPEGTDFYSWAMQGYLSIVDAEYIEQDQVADWIIRQSGFFDLLGVGYDPANARWTVLQLEGKGLPCEVVRQGPITLNDPMKDIKEMLLSRRVVSNCDPMLRWYTDNVRLSREARHADKANWMPTKRKRDLKIDGFMAWLFAHTLAMRRMETPYDDARYEITSFRLD